MLFTKMQGAGNDFIIIDNRDGGIPRENYSRLAARLCVRRLSLGADGMMFVERPEKGGDFAMRFYNSDGSLGEMCGNGARCICRYGFENGLAGDVQRVETTAGLVTGRRIDKRRYEVRLNDPSVIKLSVPVEACGRALDVSYLELGRPGLPHCVAVLNDWDAMEDSELRAMGKALRYCALFPKGANATFVKIEGPDRLKAVTYERGVEDFTLACGTGCGSVVSALTLRGLVSGRNVLISMPGGELSVTVTRDGDGIKDIMLTGPTNIVARGEITDEDLNA
jgi:diaminopimelate epimerase